MDVWLIDETEDGLIELTAPNGELLFAVSKETAEMIGEMLLEAVGEATT